MNASKTRIGIRVRRIAALLIVAVLLSGCGRTPTESITLIQPTPVPAQEPETPEDYVGADLFVPGAPTEYEYDDQIYPAAPDMNDWTADGSFPSQEDARPGSNAGSMTRGDLTYGVVVGDEAEISPFRNVYRDFYAVNQLVFESVVDLDENMRPVEMLAQKWEPYEGGFEITLRSGIEFHSGQLLSAYDVLASYEEIQRNPSTVWYELTQHIDRLDVVDDLTLRVKGKGGMGYMVLYAMTFPVAQAGTVSLDWPMGTGPYWYMQYNMGTSLRLESNPRWWRRATDTVHSVVVLCYKSTQSAMVGLELKEVDAIATDYPTASLSRSLTDRLTRDYSTQTYECIVPNLRNQILSDLNVRQALMYAIDRATIGNTIYAGMVQESEVPVTPGSWLYNPQATRFNYSPERALKLLYDAGWSDPEQEGVLKKNIGGEQVRLSLRLITYDRGTTVTRSEAIEEIARELRMVGFEVTTETMTDASAVQSAMNKGKYDLALVGFELSLVPNLSFLFAEAANNSSNYQRYASGVMDSYLREAYNAQTALELQEAMAKVQIQIVEDLPILGLFFRAGVLISRAPITGFKGTRQYDVLRGLATTMPNIL